MWLNRSRRRSTPLGRRLRGRFRRAVVERLESRMLLASGSLDISLDPVFDMFGFQPETTQFYEDKGSMGAIFDTGASVVTFSATDQLIMDPFGTGAGIPIKVPGGAWAEGIGGMLFGDVSQPGTVLVDGIHVNVFTGDIFESGVYFDQIEGRGSVVSAASASELTGDDRLNLEDGVYSGYWLVFTSTSPASAANLGVSRAIAGYDGDSRSFTFASAFPAVPASGDRFHVIVGQGVVAGPLPGRDRLSADAAGLGLASSPDAYVGRYLLFTSGALAGKSQLISGYDGATRTFELALPMPKRPAVGDTFDVVVGTGSSAIMPGVQVFVGTFEGSNLLSTISGTPMLNPTSPLPVGSTVPNPIAGPQPMHPNGLALEVGPQELLLDLGEMLGDFDPFLGELFAGITLPIPSVEFREPGTLLEPIESFYAESTVVGSPLPTASLFAGSSELPSEPEFQDFFIGFHLRFLSGGLAGETRQVSDYDAATRALSFDTPFSAAPAPGDLFELVRISTERVTVGLDFIDIDNHLDPGDLMTASPNPVTRSVTIAEGPATLSDQVFLFDTGAQLSTISVDEALALGFNLSAPEFTVSVQGAGGVVGNIPGFTLDELSIPTLEGGTLTFHNVPVFVLDVDEEIQGLLGMNLFNSAAEFLYDPFDPNHGIPTLQMTFFNERAEVAPEDIDLSHLEPLQAALLESVATLMPAAFGSFVGLRAISLPTFGSGVDLDLTPQSGIVTQENGVTVVTVPPGTVIPFTAEVGFAADFYDSFQLDFAATQTGLGIRDWVTDGVWTPIDAVLSFPGDSSVSAQGPASLGQTLGTFVVDAPLATGDYLLTAHDGAGGTRFWVSGSADPLSIRDFGNVIVRVREAPSLSVSDAVVIEGPDGTVTDLVFTVTLSGEASGTISVDYATVDDSATVAGGDYTSTAGTLQFAPGQRQKTVTVPVRGDAVPEPDEQLFLKLSGATMQLGDLVLTPVSDVTGVKGFLWFDHLEPYGEVELRADGGRAFALEFPLGDIPAGATIASATLTFVETTDNVSDPNFRAMLLGYPGNADGVPTLAYPFNTLLDNELGAVGNGSVGTQSVDVTAFIRSLVTGGKDFAGFYVETLVDEYYVHSSEAANSANRPALAIQFNSAPTPVEIADDQGVALIRNDDTEISISDRQRPEGDAGSAEAVFLLQLSQPSALEVTVHYATADGTAQAASDYQPASGTVVFAPGTTSSVLAVSVLGDRRAEPDETFLVELSSPANARLATSQGTGTILDNDAAAIIVTPTSGLTTSENGGAAQFSVVLQSQPSQNVTIALSSSDLTEGTVWPSTLTFTPDDWQQPQTVTVSGVDDDVIDGTVAYTIITAPAASSDPYYAGLDAADVLVANRDNEPAGVVGRYVFYNNSWWDAPAQGGDDGAIATDKTALLPGGTATFANYTSYSRGINGIMVDLVNLPGTPAAADFQFKRGNDDNPGNWPLAPNPASVTVRPMDPNGDGVVDFSRVTLVWADGAIQKCWLQVTVLATAATGLAQNDIFYFGNAVGDSGEGNTSLFAFVTVTDELGARNNPHSFLNRAAITDEYDYNRDSLVTVNDELIARSNSTTFLNALRLITAPAAKSAPAGTTAFEAAAAQGDLRQSSGSPTLVKAVDPRTAITARAAVGVSGVLDTALGVARSVPPAYSGFSSGRYADRVIHFDEATARAVDRVLEARVDSAGLASSEFPKLGAIGVAAGARTPERGIAAEGPAPIWADSFPTPLDMKAPSRHAEAHDSALEAARYW